MNYQKHQIGNIHSEVDDPVIGLHVIVNILGFDLKSPKRIRCLSVIGTFGVAAAPPLITFLAKDILIEDRTERTFGKIL